MFVNLISITRLGVVRVTMFLACIISSNLSHASIITLDIGFTVNDWMGTGEFAADGTPGSLSITYDSSSFIIPPPPSLPPPSGLTLSVADYIYSGTGVIALDNGLSSIGVFEILVFDYTYTSDMQRDEDIANNISVTDQLFVRAVISAPNEGWGSVSDNDLSFAFFFNASDSFLFSSSPDTAYSLSLSDFSFISANVFALSCDVNGSTCGGINIIEFEVNDIEVSSVPLPQSILLLLSGLGILAFVGKRRKLKGF